MSHCLLTVCLWEERHKNSHPLYAILAQLLLSQPGSTGTRKVGNDLQKWMWEHVVTQKGSVILIYSNCTELHHCCASSPDMREKQCGWHGVMIHVVFVLFTLTAAQVLTEERVTDYQHQIKASRLIQYKIFSIQRIFLFGASVPVSVVIL